MLLKPPAHLSPSRSSGAARQARLRACQASSDPLADWQGHLPVSGYYPCAGRDWSPILVDLTDTWLYVDYAPLGDQDAEHGIREWLSDPPEGLTLESLHGGIPPSALSSWAPWPYLPDYSSSSRKPIEQAPNPFAMLAVYRREDGRKLRLMYVIGEATATLMAIYSRQPYTPMILALIQMGYGLGGGWNRFFDPKDYECSMRHFFRLHAAGIPPYVLNNGYMPPAEFPVMKRIVIDTYNKLELRTTHQDYGPIEADVGMLYDMFPGYIQVTSELDSERLGVNGILDRRHKPMASCR